MQQLIVYGKISFGIFAASGGITFLVLKSLILDYIADSILILKPESSIKDIWIMSPEEMPTDVYFYNWTNPQDFHNLSVKPKFEQFGPYRYRQYMEKTNVIWNDNNTVTYNQRRFWYFDEEHTNASLTDALTTVDIMAMSFAHHIRYWDYFIKSIVSAYFATNSYQIHFTKTADEFLHGFEDVLLDLNRLLPFAIDDLPKPDKFGLISLKNATDIFDGTFNVANGFNRNFDLLNWNYVNVTSYFNEDCAKVRSSTGELYSGTITKDYVDIFVPDICRPLRFDFEEEVTVRGIKGYKYSIGRSALDNGTLVQGNDCFCNGDCIPSGMINISSCRYGMPYYPSLPHFYGGDQVYLDAVDGLVPDRKKHETYVVVEPKTGILLKAVVKFQMNILIHPIEGIRLYDGVRKIYFPLLWCQQIVVLPYAQRVFLKIFLVSSDVIMGTSIVLICLGLYVVLYLVFKSKVLAFLKKIRKQDSIPQQIKAEEVPLRQEGKKTESLADCLDGKETG